MKAPKKIRPRIEVRHGLIHVNTVTLIGASGSSAIICADLRAKYARITGFGDRSVLLGKDNRTLNFEERVRLPTEIRITNLPSGRWAIEASLSRYTLFIFIFRMKRGRQIWIDSE